MRTLIPAATSSVAILLLAAGLQAQTARRSTVTVQVTDGSGNPLGGVVVKATGPVDRDGATDKAG
jgi:hypothetical protein